jgi:hypothetical protein
MSDFGIEMHGPFSDISGIAYVARNLAINLYDLGIPVKIHDLKRWPGIPASLPEIKKRKLESMRSTSLPKRHIFHNQCPPNHIFATKEGVPNTGWGIFETDRIPYLWHLIVDQYDIKELWVPTQFNKDTFITGGIPESKIQVLPVGIETDKYSPDIEPAQIKGSRGFNFFTMMDVKICKGFDILLDAYFQEFSHKDDVALIFKGYSGGIDPHQQRAIKDIIQNFKQKNKSSARILFIGGNVDDDIMPSLHKLASCYVLPTRGEGFSYGSANSMACGIPAIMTNASGHLAYMNESNGLLIKCEKKLIDNIPWLMREANQGGHYWWEPDLNDLKTKMRWAYEHPGELKVLGQKARQDILAWDWKKVAPLYINRIIKLVG